MCIFGAHPPRHMHAFQAHIHIHIHLTHPMNTHTNKHTFYYNRYMCIFGIHPTEVCDSPSTNHSHIPPTYTHTHLLNTPNKHTHKQTHILLRQVHVYFRDSSDRGIRKRLGYTITQHTHIHSSHTHTTLHTVPRDIFNAYTHTHTTHTHDGRRLRTLECWK